MKTAWGLLLQCVGIALMVAAGIALTAVIALAVMKVTSRNKEDRSGA